MYRWCKGHICENLKLKKFKELGVVLKDNFVIKAKRNPLTYWFDNGWKLVNVNIIYT